MTRATPHHLGYTHSQDGRIVTNGCACRYTGHIIGNPHAWKRQGDDLVIEGEWDTSGCRVHRLDSQSCGKIED